MVICLILLTLDASLDIGLYVYRYREAMSSSHRASESFAQEELHLVSLYQARGMHEGRDAEGEERRRRDAERRGEGEKGRGC